MGTFIQYLIYGLQLGSIYALLALGYSMVYGIIGLINFAHGDFLMVGAFIAVFAAALLHLGFIPVLILSMVLTGLLGVATERIAYKPLRKRPRLAAFVTAIGVSIILENLPRALALHRPGAEALPFPHPYGEIQPGRRQHE